MRIFKVTLPKILTASILFFVFATISPPIYRYLVLDAHLRGLPFPFIFVTEGCTSGVSGCTNIFWNNLAFDIIFWYLVANLFDYLNEIIKKSN